MLGAARLLVDRQSTLEERPRLLVSCKGPLPITCEPIEQIGGLRLHSYLWSSPVLDQRQRDRIQSPCPRPTLRVTEDVMRIDRRQCLHERAQHILTGCALTPRSRDLANQTM